MVEERAVREILPGRRLAPGGPWGPAPFGGRAEPRVLDGVRSGPQKLLEEARTHAKRLLRHRLEERSLQRIDLAVVDQRGEKIHVRGIASNRFPLRGEPRIDEELARESPARGGVVARLHFESCGK